MRRPDVFTLDYSHPLAQGLVFAGMGQNPGTLVYRDDSLYQERGMLQNMPVSSWVVNDSVINRNALFFDGVDDQVTFNNVSKAHLSGATTFTVACWVRIGNSASGNDMFLGSGYNQGWMFEHYNRKPSIWLKDTSGGDVAAQPIKTWQQWTVVVAGTAANTRHYYINGELIASTGAANTGAGSRTTLYIGRNGQSNNLAFNGHLADPLVYNRALSEAEIALLADRTDPMLGGLIVEERPVLFFDMGGAPAVEGPAVIAAESTLALLGQKGAVGPAAVAASASVGMGGVKGASAPLNIVGAASIDASGQKSTSGPATISAESTLGMGGIKTLLGLDKEGPAVIAASSSVGMGGVKGAIGQAWIGADSALVVSGNKAAAGQALVFGAFSLGFGSGGEVAPILPEDIRGRIVAARRRASIIATNRRTVIHA